MDIIREKIVTTRKKHNCSACGRMFDVGTKMKTQVNTYYGIHTWRECPTCQELLSEHLSHFKDDYGVCHQNCVDESLDIGQTPEELLASLNKTLI